MPPKRLVFVVPGLDGQERNWEPLLSRLRNEPGLRDGTEALWEFWPHGLRGSSFRRVKPVALELQATINETFTAKGPFDDVILVGHSVGALLIREAYLRASNAYQVNRTLSGRIIAAIAKLTFLYERMTVYDLARGSAFITDLRLAWIRYVYKLADRGADPIVVQFLGTTDTIVARVDSLDTEQFPNGTVIDIPDASHGNLYRLDAAADPDARYTLFRKVFVQGYRTETAGHRPPSERRKIVFVLHGIRASNTGWVDETAQLAEKVSNDVIAIRASYGYFSALHFFLPWVRRTRARWFQDRYSELAAQYPAPETQFCFIGHSNGTYMLGRGLERVSMMRFQRAYIVGSVLPRTYPWTKRIGDRQIFSLCSDASAWDWPVGLLCSALSFMGDIGTGGFWGFEAAPPEMKEFRYYKGGHSKPLEDRRHLQNIVDYVINGIDVPPKRLQIEPAYAFGVLSRALKYVGPILLATILGGLAYEIYNNFIFSVWWVGGVASFFAAMLVLAII
jgi:predicted esterase